MYLHVEENNCIVFEMDNPLKLNIGQYVVDTINFGVSRGAVV